MITRKIYQRCDKQECHRPLLALRIHARQLTQIHLDDGLMVRSIQGFLNARSANVKVIFTKCATEHSKGFQ